MYGEIFLPRDHICGLKWVNVHPSNPARGLLTVMAKIILNDPDTGLEFADLDGTHITDYRTGAAGGIAVKYLARPGATRLGLIGAGAQARTQVAAIFKVQSHPGNRGVRPPPGTLPDLGRGTGTRPMGWKPGPPGEGWPRR